jgi:hypothetical protein
MIFGMANSRFLFLILALFISTACAPKSKIESKRATQRCQMELKDFPAFRGLKIGMPFELNPMSFDNQKYSLKYRTDSSVQDANKEIENPQELGYIRRTFHVNLLREQLKDQKLAATIDTKNLFNIEVEVFDGKLINFMLRYDEIMKSPSYEDTVEKFAESLKLSKENFDISIISSCFCKDFTVSIRDVRQIELEVSPEQKFFYNISNTLIDRDKERTQRKQNTFTP